MKKTFTLFILVLSIGFFGCSEDENPDQQIIGTWELTESIGSWPVENPSGNDENYFISYRFNQEGTFIKTTIFNGDEKTATGTYTTETNEEGSFAILVFQTGIDIVQSCFSSAESEAILIASKNRIEVNTSPCDGPRNLFSKK